MRVQSNKIKPVPGPSDDEVERVLERIVDFSFRSEIPKGLEVDKENAYIKREDLMRLVGETNSKGGTGLPMGHRFPKKKDVKLYGPASEVTEIVADRLQNLLSYSYEDMEKMSHRELLENSLADPVKMHVKDEYTSLSKTLEGRLRLIMGVGLIEEMTDRVLFENQNKTDTHHCYEANGTASGVDMNSDEGVKKFWDVIMAEATKKFGSDVKAWDWSVMRWMYEIELEARRRLNGASKNSAWYDLARKRTLILCRATLVTSDGEMYVLEIDGVVKSGCYNTTYSNSRCRDALAVLTYSTVSKSMGDDNLAGIPIVDGKMLEECEIKALYARWGFTLTDFKVIDDSFEFCSHLFVDGVAIPLNHTKALLNLLMETPDQMLIEQFFRTYRHSPHIKVMREFLECTEWARYLP